MSTSALVNSAEFRNASESEQIEQLRATSPNWKAMHDTNPARAIDVMREMSGYEAPDTESTSAAGRIIRQFSSGLGETVTDLAAAPFNLAEYMGLENEMDDTIERFAANQFPAPMTREGEIARAAGHGAGIAGSFFLGGTGIARAGIPVISKVGKFLTGPGMTTEMVAGGVGDASYKASENITSSEILRFGAAIVGGMSAAGLANTLGRSIRGSIERRGTAKAAENARRLEEVGEKYKDAPRDYDAQQKRLKEADQEVPTNIDDLAPDNLHLSPEGQAAVDRYREAYRNLSLEDIEALKAQGLYDPRLMEDMGRALWRQQREFIDVTINNPELTKKLLDATSDAMERAGLQLDPELPVYTQLAAAVHSGVIPRNEVDEILASFGVSMDDLSMITFGAVLEPGRSAAQVMNKLSQIAKRRKQAAEQKKALGHSLTDEEASLLADGVNAQGLGTWQRLNNVWRGALVSQMASAVRDFASTTTNIGVNTLADGLEYGISRMFPGRVQTDVTSLANSFDILGRLFSADTFKRGPSKTYTNFQELQDFLKIRNDFVLDPLVSQFASDLLIAPSGGVIGGLERGVLYLNTMRRAQDFAVRRAVFNSTLDRKLAARGMGSLDEMVESGTLNRISNEDIKSATAKAMELTWSKNYSRNSANMGESITGSIIHAINNTGLGPFRAAQIVPFPRFMANSMEWIWKHSPAKLGHIAMSPTARAEFAAGNIRPFIESTVGTGMLLSAYQMRQSHGGDKWSEMRVPDVAADTLGIERGTTLDTRPYNPFSSYLFASDLVKRMNDGTLHNMTMKDAINGVAAANVRAGAGMFVVDETLNAFSDAVQGYSEDDAGVADTLGGFLGDFAGASWSGFLTPLQQVRDVVAQFDESQRVVRDTRSERFTGAFKAKIPYADENIPELELPTQGGPLTRDFPVAKQLTGMTFYGPKNAARGELDRLGFSTREILGVSGKDPFGQVVASHMGPLVENYISQVVENPEYQAADNATKSAILERKVKQFRAEARKRAARERPDLYRATKEGRVSKRQRRARKSLTDRSRELEDLRRGQT